MPSFRQEAPLPSLQALPTFQTLTYPDTAGFLVKLPLSKAQRNALSALCRSVTCFRSAARKGGWSYSIVVQGPTPEAIEFIEKLYRGKVKPNQVHYAFDFIAATEEDALLLKNYLAMHAVQRWRGPCRLRCVNSYKNTLYWRPKGKARNIAMYADQPSKLSDDPCCHYEFRFTSAAACRRIGIFAPKDIFAVDLEALWRREITLYQLDPTKLDRFLDSIARKSSKSFTGKTKSELRLRIKRFITHANQTEDGLPRLENIPAQGYFDQFDRSQLRSLFTEIYPSPFPKLELAMHW